MQLGTHQLQCKKGHQNPERLANGRCKKCNLDYQRRYMKKRRDENIVRERSREKEKSNLKREENRNRAYALFGNRCKDCGNEDRRVFEFDHLRDKEKTISELLSRRWETLLKELKKCELVCGNCHNIRTYERRIALCKE